MVRVKFRYIVVEVQYADEKSTDHSVSEKNIYHSVKSAVEEAHGDFGVGALMRNLHVVYYNPQTDIAMIRAARGMHQLVQTSICFIKKIGRTDGYFRTLHLGGTIRSCKKFLLKYHKLQLRKAILDCKSEEEKQRVKDAILASCAELRKFLEET